MNSLIRDRIQETVAGIEQSGDLMMIDESAWLIGSIPLNDGKWVHEEICGRKGEKAPKIFKLLDENDSVRPHA